MPDKLREMQELFLVQAAKYQVFSLDNDFLARVLAPKPSYTAGRTEFIYTGELTGTPNGDAPNILAESGNGHHRRWRFLRAVEKDVLRYRRWPFWWIWFVSAEGETSLYI